MLYNDSLGAHQGLILTERFRTWELRYHLERLGNPGSLFGFQILHESHLNQGHGVVITAEEIIIN